MKCHFVLHEQLNEKRLLIMCYIAAIKQARWNVKPMPTRSYSDAHHLFDDVALISTEGGYKFVAATD